MLALVLALMQAHALMLLLALVPLLVLTLTLILARAHALRLLLALVVRVAFQ